MAEVVTIMAKKWERPDLRVGRLRLRGFGVDQAGLDLAVASSTGKAFEVLASKMNLGMSTGVACCWCGVELGEHTVVSGSPASYRGCYFGVANGGYWSCPDTKVYRGYALKVLLDPRLHGRIENAIRLWDKTLAYMSESGGLTVKEDLN